MHLHNCNEVPFFRRGIYLKSLFLGEAYTLCLSTDSSDHGSISWWIEGLNLSEADADILTSGKALTDSLVNGAQILFKEAVSSCCWIPTHCPRKQAEIQVIFHVWLHHDYSDFAHRYIITCMCTHFVSYCP